MDVYDADVAPDPEEWLGLDESDRTLLVNVSHDGCFPDALHNEGANEILHASLHKIVENQAALNDPPEVRAAIERMTGEGLRRHAAVHAVMQRLADGLSKLKGGQAFDNATYAAKVGALTAGDALGAALQNARFSEEGATPSPNPAPNRAARREAKKQERRNRGSVPKKKRRGDKKR